MAQDVEKQQPDMVREIGGRKVIGFGLGGQQPVSLRKAAWTMDSPLAEQLLANNPWGFGARHGGGIATPGARNLWAEAIAQAGAGGTLPGQRASFTAPAIQPGREMPTVEHAPNMRGGGNPGMTSVPGVGGGGKDIGSIGPGLEKLGAGIAQGLAALKQRQQMAARGTAQPNLDKGSGNPGAGIPGQQPGTAGTPPLFTQPGVAPTTGAGKGVAGADYYTRLASIENPGGNPNATSPTGATGTYQFLPSTWRQYGGGADIHGDQTDAIKRFTQANYDTLSNALGRPPTSGELYLAHQQGAAGAVKMLTNPNSTPAQLGLGNAAIVNHLDPDAPASKVAAKIMAPFTNVASPFVAVPDTVSARNSGVVEGGRFQGTMNVGGTVFPFATGGQHRGASGPGEYGVQGFDPNALGGRGAFRVADQGGRSAFFWSRGCQ
jgi:hypothetical protein